MYARKFFVGVSLLMLALAIVANRAVAQSTTATVSGVVSDSTGAILPGARVVVMNADTGAQRSATTDEKGSFLVTDLPPGPYQVTVSQPGFETLVRTGITLSLSQQANLTLAMKVGAVTEQVTVTGEAPLVNTSSSSVSGVVEEQRIEELPLNGRDFSQLPLVQPGVSAVRNGDITVSKGYGARISMGGSRPDQTAWLLDGTYINSPSNFGTPGSAAGVMLGVDAVREFQVLTSDYKAELGGTSGGVVNMITKSGTNNLHGSLYEYLRNSALDARNFFDIPSKPAFKRNQFGGSVGGRIVKDKTFFFGNYEGLRQRQGVTLNSTVPDANAHLGIVNGQQLTVAPEVRGFLNIWPMPNGPELLVGGRPSGFANLFGSGNSSVDENYFVVRGDHHISDKQTLFARVTFDQGGFTQPDPVPIYSNKVAVHSRYTTLQHDYILTPQFLMTTRASYNRTLNQSTELPLVNVPSSLNILNKDNPPTVTIPGATTIGPSGNNLIGRIQNFYAFQEDVQYIHGSHSIRFGGLIERVGTNLFNQLGQINGQLSWNSLGDFLVDNSLSALTYVAQGSDPFRTWQQSVYGVYAQDDWKMRPNFTWNFGVRYEPFTAPNEKHGRLSAVKDWTTATSFDVKQGLFKSPGKKDVSPRVGFAWDPKGDGKTAIRAGAGLFFVDVLSAYYGTPGGKNPPFAGSTSQLQGNLTTTLSRLRALDTSLLTATMTPNTLMDFIQYNLNPTYELKMNFTVERQLPGGMSVSLGYLGDRGTHLWRLDDVNDPFPTMVNGRPFIPNGSTRPNSHVGVGTVRFSDAKSFYNAMQLEVKKRFSHGFQLQSSYTWSKNVDDSTTGVAQTDFVPGGVGNTNQPYNPKADRGLSALNIGQTFVINGIYQIPTMAQSGIAHVVLGGWQVANIFTANSGAPFTVFISGRNAQDQSRQAGVQHPDLVAGRSFSSIVTGNPNAYFDPKAFFLPPPGFYGNAGRDILTGPGLMNFDISLQKSTPLKIGESTRLDFHADFFNLFNRANFANPRAAQAQVLNPANGQLIAGAGKITSTVTNPRQLQFGLKLIF